MSSCALVRLLVPAALVGMAVSTLTSSEALGWVAAVTTAVVIGVVSVARGTRTTCPIDPAHTVSEPSEGETDCSVSSA